MSYLDDMDTPSVSRMQTACGGPYGAAVLLIGALGSACVLRRDSYERAGDLESVIERQIACRQKVYVTTGRVGDKFWLG